MRLSCPNCGAQYEVPDDVIPQAGRDVQCSNCGHTWFQGPAEEDVSPGEELGESVSDEGMAPEDTPDLDGSDLAVTSEDPAHFEEDEVQPPSVEIAEHTDEERSDDLPPLDDENFSETFEEENADFEQTADEEDGFDDVEEEDLHQAIGQAMGFAQEEHAPTEDVPPVAQEEDASDFLLSDEDAEEPLWSDDTIVPDDEDEDHGPSDAPRKSLNPEIAEILREEAQHEARFRAEEATVGLETQPDLGLRDPQPVPETNKRAREARERMRRLRGIPEQEAQTETQPEPTQDLHASRRDLLPDIEEINSSLRAADDRENSNIEEPAIYGERQRRRGFRLGFGIMLLLAAGAILAYVYNQQITASVPGAAPYIESYLDNVNNARVWLDGQITKMMLALQNASGE